MPGTDHETIEVRVHGLRTAHEAIVFTPGTPTAPFSIGANGQWGVVGDGVGAIHLFLGFDGQRVLVAGASPGLPVQFAGGSVGSSWVTVPVPSEIRFGAGVLVLRRTARSGAPANPDAAPSTVSDGGALYQAAQRAHSGPVAGSSSPPRAAKSKDFGATVLMDPRAQATSEPPPPAAVDQRLQAPTAIASLPPMPPPRGPSPPTPPPPASPDLGGSSPSLDESVLKKNFWQTASPVKKATIVLLPVALIVSFFMLQDDHAPAPSAPPAPGALATARAPSPPPMTAPPPAEPPTPVAVAPAQPAAVAPSPPALPRTAPTAASAPPTALAAAKPGDSPGKAGQRTPQRTALDTVASGAFDDAARQYDALAMAHPDDPTFKQAARVLRLKSGHTH